MPELKVHPLAGLFPLMEGKQYEDLRTDIAAHGLVHPIVRDNGTILDGRNRQRACDETGRPAVYMEFSHMHLGCTPEQYIWASNAERRHLTDEQKAAISDKYAEVTRQEAKQRQKEGGKTAGRGRPKKVVADSPQAIKPRNPTTRRKVAQQAGVSEHQVKQAEYVRKHAPELSEKVIAGEMKLPKAVKEAKRRAILRPKQKPTTVMEMNLSSSGEITKVKYFGRDGKDESRPSKTYSDAEVDGAVAATLKRFLHTLEDKFSGSDYKRFILKFRDALIVEAERL